MNILGEKIISSGLYISSVKIWIKGWVKMPNGVFHFGLTGPETECEINVIKALRTFSVAEQPIPLETS